MVLFLFGSSRGENEDERERACVTNQMNEREIPFIICYPSPTNPIVFSVDPSQPVV